MSAITAFFAGVFLSWPTLIILFIFGVLSEHNGSRGWAVFWALLVLPISYFFFEVSGTTLLICSISYLAIGIGWSFFRYKRYIVEAATAIRTAQYDDAERKRRVLALHPTKKLDTIVAWIVIWPFSAIENFAGDLIDLIRTLVTKVFKGIYFKIYTATVGDLID